MPISITKYVNITSGVGAGTNVPQRDLIGRFFTGNDLIPADTFVQFSNASEAASFFGPNAEETARAQFYFSWISKTINQPAAIQFARWVNVAVAPMITSVSTNTPAAFGVWAALTNTAIFGITIGGVVGTVNPDFTGAGSLTDVAADLQTAIRATGSGAMFTSATVTFTNGAFVFTGGAATAATISIQGGLSSPDITLSGFLGWNPAAQFNANTGVFVNGAITTPGAGSETITQALTNSAAASNNFGSFMFLNNLALSLPNAIFAATWNLSQNNSYLFCAPVTSSNYAAWSANSGGLGTFGGTALTLSGYTLSIQGQLTSSSPTITNLTSLVGLAVGNPISGTDIPANTYILAINSTANTITMSQNASGSTVEAITFTPWQFPEQIPMMIEAATNYTTGINSVQNYMFQDAFTGITPLVTTDAQKTQYDAVSVNYYGQTQTSGQLINFYQNGVLLGASPSPLDMNTYVNEIWLKDAATAAIMNLLLNLTQLPANAQGVSQILASLQVVINQALLNGTISVNKALNITQQQFITSATGDPDAWYQVQSDGYWINAEIVPSGSNPVIYTANYTLIYSKDDVIRLVTGQDILI